ncbi:Rnf-Nqr domain containing protein [Zongyangia hominis]|uniref:NADH:ubiquinone oxidoreductase, subunit RnfA n=1 Tax=Zongyangia hominis TaxID=2763677 RepID=A0A926E9K1_9FIRM|nr:Rnf-Nqr domain containing protein [Zongyangia hominis]MBC8570425.1 NADH:ubiquinone oxidoreductase, subunit RnfA [Zongyangia hominis]
MDAVTQFFLMALVAVFTENAIFTRALGASRALIELRSSRSTVLFGAVLTAITFLSSLLCYPANIFLRKLPYYLYLEPLVFVFCIGAVYAVIHLLMSRFLPKAYKRVSKMLPMATFNSALLGAILVALHQSFDLPKTLGFGLGTGIGFTFAALLICEGQKRMELSRLPRSFRGLPATLLFIGILSLAFYGLIGHQLPS